MPRIQIIQGDKVVGSMQVAGDYNAGDQPPTGYTDRHEWAAVQHKAGLRQKKCTLCSKFKYPQEIAKVEPYVYAAYKTRKDAILDQNLILVHDVYIVCDQCAKIAGPNDQEVT